MSESLTIHAKIIVVATCLIGAGAAMETARAATISYSVAGVAAANSPSPLVAPADSVFGADGYPGDSVGLDAYSGTLDLTPGVQTIALNTLRWTVNPTYYGGETGPWPEFDFTQNLNRSITLDGVTGGLTQSGSIHSTYFTDTLSVAASTSNSLIVDGYRVTITAQPTAPVDASDWGAQTPQTLYATVDISAAPKLPTPGAPDHSIAAVPEPSTWAMMILGIGGLGAVLRRRRSGMTAPALALG